MINILYDLTHEIRRYIENPLIQNDLIKNKQDKWLRLTASLDTIEDASSAEEYYVNNTYPDDLGGKYLFTYGLLQELYVIQDCVTSMKQSLFGENIDFKEYPCIYLVRKIRSDILHPTNRGKCDSKSFIYLTQWNLSKDYLEYYRQSKSNIDLQAHCYKISDLITLHDYEINDILLEIKEKLAEQIKLIKEKSREIKMKNIFGNLLYAQEKMTENGVLFDAGYKSVKTMVDQYKKELDKRFASWEMCDSDTVELEKIEKIFDILDNRMGHINDPDTSSMIKDCLIDNLCHHMNRLHEYAIEYDAIFDETGIEDVPNTDTIIINICSSGSQTDK